MILPAYKVNQPFFLLHFLPFPSLPSLTQHIFIECPFFRNCIKGHAVTYKDILGKHDNMVSAVFL